jgi:prophage tail gpP-like protein
MKVRATITSRYGQKSYSPQATLETESFMVDSAMDTDTDSWNLAIGDVDRDFRAVLRRDAEVRVQIFGQNEGRIQNLNMGFADEITLDESNVLNFSGRDITSVAVDSQRPPGNFRQVRPQILVARDARTLKIGDRLRLTKAPPFKKFHVDGSESYWEVWYRLYRKRRMWLWAEPDGTLIAGTLNYNANPTYFIGGKPGNYGRLQRQGWLPVERVEIRSNKQQRVWEVFVIGDRGDVSFVSHARDRTIRDWIKRRQVFLRSDSAHGPGEAKAEAWEELFESKVGAVEIKVTIADPGFVLKQNRVARVDISEIGLKGDFYVVGVRTYASGGQGIFQEVRLREKNYAISKRVPSDPKVQETPSEGIQGGAGGIADTLGIRWKEHFVEAANKHHGPWPFQLFLAVLISIAEQETGFRNVRGGGSDEWPGTANGQAPSQVTQTAAFRKFAATYANDPRFGRVNQIFAVGPMQLYSPSYKDHADQISGLTNDELGGGRWMPRYNIIGGAFALRDKLKGSGAEAALGRGGSADKLIWEGVADYGHLFPGETTRSPTGRYAREVRERYEDTYKVVVDEAVKIARQNSKSDPEASVEIPTGTVAELKKRVLDNKLITYAATATKNDITFGLVDVKVLRFLLAFSEAGFASYVWVFKTGHSKFTAGGNISKHWYGLAVDLGNYQASNIAESRYAMTWIKNHQTELGFSQLIGPVPELCVPLGIYDAATLADHKDHIHVGW